MPWLKMKDGTVAHICTRGSRNPLKGCRVCGFLSSKICDYVYAGGRACDASLCEDHAVAVGQDKTSAHTTHLPAPPETFSPRRMAMPFDSVSRVIARVAVWLFFLGVCVAFWWALLERYGFYAIAVFFLGGVIWILLMLWLEFRDRRNNGIPGVCRYCGCTNDRECTGGCAWLDETCTSCDAPLCQMRKAAGQ